MPESFLDAAGKKDSKEKISILFYIVPLLVLWTTAVAVSLWFSIETSQRYTEDMARTQARTAFEKDVIYRRWNSGLGAVYAKVTEKTPPNPYLARDKERDITTPSGIPLTKINPAYMTRLVHEMGDLKSGVKGHITSNDPIRPQNEPDPWERKALIKLENGEASEVSSVEKINGADYMRVIGPLVTEKSCLPCHPTYIEGQLRGGISVSVPMAPLLAKAQAAIRSLILSHLVLWLLGAAVVVVGGRRLTLRVKERNKAEQALRQLTNELEERVNERTESLRRRQQELQSFMANTEAGVFLKNEKGEYILINPSFAQLVNKNADDIIGRTSKDILPPAVYEKIKIVEDYVIAAGESAEVDDLFDQENNPNGRIHSASIFPVINDQKQTEGVGGVLVDVTQRRRMEKVLLEAKNQAEMASRAKSEFLANISHEIRTPLNGVIGMADLLLRSSLTEDQAAMAATIKTGGDSLLSVLNDILDFSKIEAGKLYLDPMPFSLRDVVFDAVKGLTPVAYKKGLETIVHVEPTMPDNLLGDYTRIRQILLNLLSNAIKFTDKGEVSITIRCLELKDDKAVFRLAVADTGIGIPADKQAMIFNAFEQADSSTTRKYGGTGLGLAISFRLANLMNSSLRLESQLGLGTTFWLDLELPLLKDAPMTPLLNTKCLEGISVLVVDDNDANRRILLEQLNSWKAVGQEAASVDEAMRLLRVTANSVRPFKLVLSDLQMPEKDGLDLMKKMADDPILASIPVIILSSGNMPESKTLSKPFSGSLNKPVRPEELMRTMAKALGIWERFDSTHMQSSIDADHSRVSTLALNVLLAEDMEMNQVVAIRMLEDLGHKVSLAANGREAVTAVCSADYDLVFMDIQMPIMDGVEAVRLIRQREEDQNLKHLPIIAMTAHALKGDEEKYLSLGMDAYLTKPILLNNLAQCIDELIVRFEIKGTVPSEAREQAASADLAGVENSKEAALKYLDYDLIALSFGSNKDLLHKSMQIYLRDAPKLLAEINAAIDRDDNGALVVGAHALKGITSYYSKGAVFQAALELENKGRQNTLPAENVAVKQMAADFAELVEAMIDEMKEAIGS